MLAGTGKHVTTQLVNLFHEARFQAAGLIGFHFVISVLLAQEMPVSLLSAPL